MPTAGVRVILSVAVSLDGYIDDGGCERLELSHADDKAAVHMLRARCDAILVGAQAIRRDNPRLVIDDPALREQRLREGRPPDLMKVTLTRSGALPLASHFFQQGAGTKIVYCPGASLKSVRETLGSKAEVVALEPSKGEVVAMLEDLASRGVHDLMVEGGAHILTMFLRAGAVDELRVAIAPFLVGDSRAPRFLLDADFPFDKHERLDLVSVETQGDMAVLNYRPAAQHRGIGRPSPRGG